MKKLIVMMFALVLANSIWSCQNNNRQNEEKAEKALTTESTTEKQKAKAEESQDKAMFQNKVAMYAQWDEDANGQLNQAEFLKGATALFDEMDTDKNGKIDQNEWEHYKSNAKDELAAEKVLFLEKTALYSQMGDKKKWETRATEAFRKWDKNGNGTLEKDEYIQGLK